MIYGFIRGGLLLMVLWFGGGVRAQKHSTDFWFFPGVTYNVTSKTQLSGQPIWFTDAHAGGLLLRGYFKVSKHFTVNPGYLFLSRGVSGYQEHTLLNGFIYNTRLGGLVVEDRNWLWDRLRVDARDLHFYRNRLRLIRPFSVEGRAAKVYVYDEAFYFLNDGLWSRNRISVGCAYDLWKVFNLDISYVRQEDKFGGGINLIWVIGTVQL
ncbi:MAG: DUF2490 domain-containing protein [Bacteroidetes bacterium]|nr:DUF2490 domain-containing protein [Bacteroidota bacterium]